MDKISKKKITELWLQAFPDLRPFAYNKLYKIVGPFIFGLEFINLPHSKYYRVHFVVYPLYKRDVKDCLLYPVLMFEFYNKRNLQINLPWNNLTVELDEVLSLLKFKLNLWLTPMLTLEDFFVLIDENLRNNPNYNHHPGKMADLLELKFYAALYVNNTDSLQDVIHQIQNGVKQWDNKLFSNWHGDFTTWFSVLTAKKMEREEFLQQIEAIKQNEKLITLKDDELI